MNLWKISRSNFFTFSANKKAVLGKNWICEILYLKETFPEMSLKINRFGQIQSHLRDGWTKKKRLNGRRPQRILSVWAPGYKCNRICNQAPRAQHRFNLLHERSLQMACLLLLFVSVVLITANSDRGNENTISFREGAATQSNASIIDARQPRVNARGGHTGTR